MLQLAIEIASLASYSQFCCNSLWWNNRKLFFSSVYFSVLTFSIIWLVFFRHKSSFSLNAQNMVLTGRLCCLDIHLSPLLGSGCSTVVDHAPHDQVVMDWNLAACWPFSLSVFSAIFPLTGACKMRSIVNCPWKLIPCCAAWCKTSLINTEWIKISIEYCAASHNWPGS